MKLKDILNEETQLQQKDITIMKKDFESIAKKLDDLIAETGKFVKAHGRRGDLPFDNMFPTNVPYNQQGPRYDRNQMSGLHMNAIQLDGVFRSIRDKGNNRAPSITVTLANYKKSWGKFWK